MHKGLVCCYSAFFRAACTAESKEAISGHVRLPDDSAEIFDLFMQWLYTGKLQDDAFDAKQGSWTESIKLYILADKLQVPTIKNAVLDQMVSTADHAVAFSYEKDKFPSNADISLAYGSTSQTSLMRTFLAELFAIMQSFSIEKDEIPKDYLYDLALSQRAGKRVAGGPPTSMKTPCRYHEYDEAGEDHDCVARRGEHQHCCEESTGRMAEFCLASFEIGQILIGPPATIAGSRPCLHTTNRAGV